MSLFSVEPFVQVAICRDKATGEAFRDFVRALPAGGRHKISASLYPDKSSVGRFKVTAKVQKTGLLDGQEEIRAIREYVKARKSGEYHTKESAYPII